MENSTFEDLLEITTDELKPLAIKMKELVLKVDKDTVETVRLGDKAATYGIGPRKLKEGYVAIMPYKAWLNYFFYEGTSLNDKSSNLLEGTGKTCKHIKIRNEEDLSNPLVEDILRQAVSRKKENTK